MYNFNIHSKQLIFNYIHDFGISIYTKNAIKKNFIIIVIVYILFKFLLKLIL